MDRTCSAKIPLYCELADLLVELDDERLPGLLLSVSFSKRVCAWDWLRKCFVSDTCQGGLRFERDLPLLRTAIDHSTAFDIAGKGVANAESMM